MFAWGRKTGKKRKLSTEITVLTILTSVCTMLLLGAAMFAAVFFIFFQNTRDDMEYILQNTSQQFDDHMQFIGDGAVTIRHNVWLEDFFWGSSYSREAAEEQLSYSMELFSDRNIVRQQEPFVKSIYLYNNINEGIYEHYYPMTVQNAGQKQEYSYQLQQAFKQTGKQYTCYQGDHVMYLCFRLYDEEMRMMGTCIAEISESAVGLLMEDIQSYRSSAWAVIAENGDVMTSFGNPDAIEILKEESEGDIRESLAGGSRLMHMAQKCSFGVHMIAAAGLDNIYVLLKPTMLIFLVVFLVVLMAATMISFGVSYRFTKPITKIIEGIRAFGQEDFDVRMEDHPIQEFHDIGVVFNEMADRIEYLIRQVYEKQLLATQSQVKFLQAQINPHFQFNILAMLAIRAKMAGNEELYQYLQAFSKLMQGKIFRGKEMKIRVCEEMELVDFYLLLQNGRYHDKISYEIRYGSECVREDLIPRLLIEPLVENAVSHGLEPKNGDGKITVDIFEKEDRLHIIVEDDGVGFEPQTADTDRGRRYRADDDHTKTGLENMERLLQIIYGDNYQLQITGVKGQGTRVEISLPVERTEKYVESNSGR